MTIRFGGLTHAMQLTLCQQIRFHNNYMWYTNNNYMKEKKNRYKCITKTSETRSR